MSPRRILHLALGLAALLLYLAAGEWLVGALRVPVPGSVAGMVLLAATLRLRPAAAAPVRPAAEALLGSMALFFVPPGVGLMAYAALLRRAWPAIVGAGLVGTAAVLLVVGVLAQRLEARG